MTSLLLSSLLLSMMTNTFAVHSDCPPDLPSSSIDECDLSPDLPSSSIDESDLSPSPHLLHERITLFCQYITESKELLDVQSLFVDLSQSHAQDLLEVVLHRMDPDWSTTNAEFVANLAQFVLARGLLRPTLIHIAQQPAKFQTSDLFDVDFSEDGDEDNAYRLAVFAMILLKSSPREVVLDTRNASLFRDVILNSHLNEDADDRESIVEGLRHLDMESIKEFLKVFLSDESNEPRRITDDDRALIENLCALQQSESDQWCLRAVSISEKYPLDIWITFHDRKILEYISKHGVDDFVEKVPIWKWTGMSQDAFKDAVHALHNHWLLRQSSTCQDWSEHDMINKRTCDF